MAILAQKMSNIVPKLLSGAVLCVISILFLVGETTIRGGEMTYRTAV